ncbi:hypothetical protein E3N88_29190 [Mikania micrantha]|uniref:Transposase-associated domain-containing protein n=1 Tax=Mikania micrantha TaxID=192012 RepID=A0A5N6MK66_9ASTR|nr:hypothetical protein E3N88_29190 [Mikania micrantha]
MFIKGAMAFAERGKTYVDSDGRIHYPCRNCVNARRHIPTVVASHIIHNGFEPSYNIWIYHGEHLPGYETDENESEESENESNDGVDELLDDVFPMGVETKVENYKDDDNICNNPNVEKHLWDIPEEKNGDNLLEDINLLREDIADEIVENVDVQDSDANKDDFIDDDIDNSDYSMEDYGSELNLDDSETENHNKDNEIVDSDDDDDDWSDPEPAGAEPPAGTRPPEHTPPHELGFDPKPHNSFLLTIYGTGIHLQFAATGEVSGIQVAAAASLPASNYYVGMVLFGSWFDQVEILAHFFLFFGGCLAGFSSGPRRVMDVWMFFKMYRGWCYLMWKGNVWLGSLPTVVWALLLAAPALFAVSFARPGMASTWPAMALACPVVESVYMGSLYFYAGPEEQGSSIFCKSGEVCAATSGESGHVSAPAYGPEPGSYYMEPARPEPPRTRPPTYSHVVSGHQFAAAAEVSGHQFAADIQIKEPI